MVEQKAYSRLTLCLDIIGRLESGPFKGYHKLNAIKQKTSLFDVISIEESNKMEIVSDDSELPSDQSNLCWKTACVIKEKYGIDKNLKIFIQKNIPSRGGLAGGSSNAAAVITLLNRLWELDMSYEDQCSAGRDVGMDVPFFFSSSAAFDTEAGGTLKPFSTDLEMFFVLYFPRFGVSTGDAYKSLDYSTTGKNVRKTGLMLKAFEKNSMPDVIANVHNDFEDYLFRAYPEFNDIKRDMLDAGCIDTVVSGSGSTVIGFTKNRENARIITKNLPDRTLLVSTLTPEMK